MKRLLIITGLVSLLSVAALAAEQSMLARVTVYWASGGSGSDYWTRKHRAATKVRLRQGHCAVDPRRIPYGSKVILPDATLTAVDTGGHVKSRLAARRIGRSAAQRDALVIDRFFETKSQALAWAKKNPHFMKVRVVSRTNLTESSPTGETTRTTTTSTTTATRVAATKPSQPAVGPASTPPKPTVVASTAASSAVANLQTPPPRQTGLRTSVPTARTPATLAVARPPQPSSPAPTQVASNAALNRPAPRLASNSSPQTLPTAKPPAAIMVHGPSHHDRRVAYMP